ncbi:uncharacterized protein OCT59_025741 [Rhizophagus irregularis]|uniref:uncharacterized protein n=1 Tax=Rhizophagus irregularis TaxID=588596 RepID=UPI003323C3EC|nr:hypothetical protein OCT59_025741 [Rhizophagus irregularis]
MDFRCFYFGKRTEIMSFSIFDLGNEETKMFPFSLCRNARRLDDGIETNRFWYSKDPKRRNGSVLQYSKSIKYGTPDERNCQMNFYEPDLKVRAPIFRIGKMWNSGRNYEPDFVCVKGTPERIHEPGFGWKVIRERRKRKRKLRTKTKGSAVFVHMEFNISKGSTVLERMEFNISKVQWSLNIWNLTVRRFTPASTLALDI